MSRTDLNDVFGRTSFLYGGNARFIEQLYARYLNDPKSVDPQWQSFFASLNEERDSALKHTLKTLETAQRVGAQVVVLHLGSIDGKNYTDKLIELQENSGFDDSVFKRWY
jgi:2-oxoglutarate dehydrogenase complex dehydrogenase (E1) component-like enzyme